MHPANKWLIGSVGAALITSAAMLEGTVYEVYYDLAGIPTICSGHTGKDIVVGKIYNAEECKAILTKDLAKHGAGVLSCINQPLTVNQYNAFTLMALNIGVGNFCGSRAAKLFNAGLSDAACRAMAYGPNGQPVWSYVNKTKFVHGLHKRRIYEMNLCYASN